jgi:hypothetical protein
MHRDAHPVDPERATITVKVPDGRVTDPHWVRLGVVLLVPVMEGLDLDDALRKHGTRRA